MKKRRSRKRQNRALCDVLDHFASVKQPVISTP
jgi:hypothetical protein